MVLQTQSEWGKRGGGGGGGRDKRILTMVLQTEGGGMITPDNGFTD